MTAFKNRKPNISNLLAYGFEAEGNNYVYRCELMDGQMLLKVTVTAEGALTAKLFDRCSDEEYVLHRIEGAAGAFVGQVKSVYEAKLKEIAEQCFDPEVFKFPQTKAVIAYLQRTYGDELEYLWKKFPNNAIVRRRDNQKWYAAILTVSRRKLGFDSEESVEIIDLRLRPEEMETTVDHIRYFPGYHMNKKHWITVCLDDTVPIEEICRRIDASYALARK